MVRLTEDHNGIGRREFDDFRRLIHDVSGIALGDNKNALVAARVARRMRTLGVSDHADYLELIHADSSGAEACLLIDSISTNVTSFFREPQHFDVLRARIESLSQASVSDIKLWSAACATGEEPYSMAMIAHEALLGSPSQARILATDISGEALGTARSGRYAAQKTGSVPRPLAATYLKPAGPGLVEVSASLRPLVSFARINLSSPPFPMRGPFHAIMCRNVMIYFNHSTRQTLISELERLLAPGGLLMLGHAESLAGIDSPLRPIQPAVYQKVG